MSSQERQDATKDFKRRFRGELAALKQRHGWSDAQLADAAELKDRRVILRWRNHPTARPGARAWRRLRELGMDTDYVETGDRRPRGTVPPRERVAADLEALLAAELKAAGLPAHWKNGSRILADLVTLSKRTMDPNDPDLHGTDPKRRTTNVGLTGFGL